MKRFKGIFTVMLTAYDDDGNIDRAGMQEMTDYLIESGVHGLVVLGSNGECPYLSHGLQKDVIDSVVESCGKRVPVIAGINERNTDQAIEMAQYAESAGADGLLVALHIFYPLEEDSVYGYYEKIASQVNLPILFYNWPANTSLTLPPKTVARIGQVENVVGAKETIFDIEEVKGLVDATGEDFCVFTGMSFNLVAAMEVGACGAICPLPNVIPKKVVEMYEAVVAGDSEKAAGIQSEVITYAPLMASSSAPHAMLKEAVRLLGHPINVMVKEPLPQLTGAQADLVEDILKNTGLIKT